MKVTDRPKKGDKILFLLSRFLDGGIDRVLIDYLRHLAETSHYQVTLAVGIAMNELEVFAKDIPETVKVVHFVEANWLTKWKRRKVVSRKLPLWAKCYDEILLSPLQRYIIKRNLKKLAASHDAVIDFDCCYYSYIREIPQYKVAWYHFSFEQSLRQNRRRTLRIGKHLSHYDQIVCISEAMRQEGARLFPDLASKMSVIYNAKDRELILKQAAEPVDDVRIRQSYLLAVERLEESQKDLTTLLHAYQILYTKYHHTERLYLLGKGRSEARLRQLALDLGIAGQVEFLGFRANPYPWILHSRLLVHSAKFEGLPTILIEGLMLDRLIVATDCPTGPREILYDGKAGLLVPVGDAEALAESIHQLLTDKNLQMAISAHVVEHRQRFLFSHTIAQFCRLVDGCFQMKR